MFIVLFNNTMLTAGTTWHWIRKHMIMNGHLARMCKKSAGVSVCWHKHDETKEKHMNSVIIVIGLLMRFEPGSSQW